jgi:hypothetical protein
MWGISPTWEILDENLESIGNGSTVGTGVENLEVRDFRVAYSQKFLAFLNGEESSVRVFRRPDKTSDDFTEVKRFREVHAGAFVGDGGSLFVFIQSSVDNKYLLRIYDIDEDKIDEERRDLPDGSYLLVVLDSNDNRFITYEENTGKLTIWRELHGDIREEQVILNLDFPVPLGPDLFITEKGSLYRNISPQAIRFEMVWEFESSVSVARRYPSRSSRLKTAQLLSPLTPLTSLDVLEVIAGFCCEKIDYTRYG